MPTTALFRWAFTGLYYFFFGPFYTVPLSCWRLARRYVRPTFLTYVLALPGCYAIFVAAATVALCRFGADPTVGGHALAEYSPFHMLGRDIFLSLLNLTIQAPAALLWWVPLDWCLVTAYCTLFLSPLYLWLARRHAKAHHVDAKMDGPSAGTRVV